VDVTEIGVRVAPARRFAVEALAESHGSPNVKNGPMKWPWKSRRSIADDAAEAASEKLVGRSHGEIAIDTVYTTGVLTPDTKQAVVWVLLSAPDPDSLPRWFAPAEADESADPQQAALDPEVLSWMRQVREEVRQEFARRGWPSDSSVCVLFDSEARVAAGGWSYFK